MKPAEFPEGWNEERVRKLLEHYEAQSDEETVAEDEAAYESTTHDNESSSRPRSTSPGSYRKAPCAISANTLALPELRQPQSERPHHAPIHNRVLHASA